MNVKIAIKRIGERALWKVSPRLCVSLIYRRHRGRFPNLAEPQDISELILKEIVTGKVVEYRDFVDKLKARDHLADWGLAQYLPEIYGRWKSPHEVDWDSLPQRFILKTNHGSGKHYICWDKSKAERAEAVRRLASEYHYRPGPMEPQYSGIEPQCYAEELVEDLRGGGRPLDYKFMTSGGVVKAILVCSDRDKGTRLALYDLEWNRLQGIKQHIVADRDFERPPNLAEMVSIAQRIASRFTQVRVDMYSLPDGRIILGELTFTPQGGYLRNFTTEMIRHLGVSESQN